jgi:hypothetical protein
LPARSVFVAGIVEVVGLISLGEIIAYVVDMMEWAFGLFELGDDVGPHLSGTSPRPATIVPIAAATALLAWGLGLAAVGVAGRANADVCCEPYSDGSCFYYYCWSTKGCTLEGPVIRLGGGPNFCLDEREPGVPFGTGGSDGGV